ncbi:choice-of-anchor I family protein [Pseudactinotalea terrae]|uniref:choice-of-anchor I family protein n=1 Tax=Pseudactinotalea terrae TaxID=1743262 RepID=UPI0018837680|nr:choice-of-anchor I family protein [Pseudactinotalea terrae]
MPTSTPPRSPAARRLAVTAVLALSLAALAAPGLLDAAHAVDAPIVSAADDAAIELAPLGTYRTGVIDQGAAEIVVFHAGTDQLFVVNADNGTVDVLDASDPSAPAHLGELSPVGTTAGDGSVIEMGAVANSVAVRADGLIAVALEAPDKVSHGWVAFFDANAIAAGALGAVRVGSLPDNVVISSDGARAVVANEGEPDEDFAVDPEGSIAVIDLPAALGAPGQSDVRIADFHAYEAEGALPEGVRVFGPEVNTEFPVSANLEPEYAAIDHTSTMAYVSLQEANAFAVVDLASATVTDILPLGAKDHSLPENALDVSDRDGPDGEPTITIAPQPALGLYMPDTVAPYTVADQTYLVTANEGDAREWGDYVEGARVKDLGDDGLLPICGDSILAGMTGDDQLGRLNVTTAEGLNADRTCYEQLYFFGGRSFSIWSTDGDLVFDSGSQLEEIVAGAAPEFFNSNHSESNLEGRSDDKGPEPEAVTVGEVDGRSYAFVGFERVGGIAVFDITDPTDVFWVTYINNRDFSISLEDADDPAAVLDDAGDLGPESIAFISAADSPTGEPMIAVGNEVSGTTTLFAITPTVTEPPTTTPTTEPTTDPTTDPTTEPTTAPSTDPGEPTSEPTGSTAKLAVVIDGPVRPGQTVAAQISGGVAGDELTGTMYSVPVEMGTVTVTADGTATLSFRVPADTEVGSHRLVVVGAESGTAEVSFQVTAATGGAGGGLADTGVAGLTGLIAFVAIAAGAGVLLVRRARASQA